MNMIKVNTTFFEHVTKLGTPFPILLVREELQKRFPSSSFDGPLVPIDFADSLMSSLTRNGRLFNVHNNLVSKGKSLQITKHMFNS